MEYLVSVLLSIIGNLLTPAAKRLLRWPVEPDQLRTSDIPGREEEVVPTDDNKERVRRRNRQHLARVGKFLTLHVGTFLVLFAAFQLPLMGRSLSGLDIDLASTRLVILGIDATFNRQHTVAVSLALAAVFYFPLWFLSQTIGRLAAAAWDNLSIVTPSRYVSLIALSFVSLALLVAGHWTYVLFPKNSYWFSVGLPFIAIAGAAIFSGRR